MLFNIIYWIWLIIMIFFLHLTAIAIDWIRFCGFGMFLFVMFLYLCIFCGQMKWMETSTHVNDLWNFSSTNKRHTRRKEHPPPYNYANLSLSTRKKRILWKKHFTFFLNFSWELCSFFRPFLFLPIHVLLWHEAVWCCITIFVFFLVGNLCSVHWTLAGAPFHDNLTTKSNYSTLSIFLCSIKFSYQKVILSILIQN